MNISIKIYHNDWSGECLINNMNEIFRKDECNEKGKYTLSKNKLIIYWEKWDDDIFYTNDYLNYYLFDNIQLKFSEIYILEKNNQYKCQINFNEPEAAVSPGQACVFYSEDNNGLRLLGGGWIAFSK